MRAAALLLALPAVLGGALEEDFPEFANLVGGGGAPTLMADGDVEDRSLWLNSCSICESVAHQGVAWLTRLASKRAKGIRDEDASDVIERLCSAEVWKAEYGFRAKAQSVGFLAGPGISWSEAPDAAAGFGTGADNEAVAMRFKHACTELLTGGDLEEEELATLVAKEPDDKAATRELQRRICDGHAGACQRYARRYGSHHFKRDITLLKEHDEL